MNENLSDRESRIAWRLTQLVILAFLAIFVFSITDNDSDEILIQLPNVALEDETELTNNLPIATDEMKLTTGLSCILLVDTFVIKNRIPDKRVNNNKSKVKSIIIF